MNAVDRGNQGNVERAMRVLLGVALLSLCFGATPSTWGLIGVVPLVTGIAGECPIYRLLGISTRPTSLRKDTP